MTQPNPVFRRTLNMRNYVSSFVLDESVARVQAYLKADAFEVFNRNPSIHEEISEYERIYISEKDTVIRLFARQGDRQMESAILFLYNMHKQDDELVGRLERVIRETPSPLIRY
jgi:hypothetical protein